MATDKHWHITHNKNKALMLAKREIAVFVHDAVALEGIHFTLPEIQTLLEGITVGGYKLSDQQIAVNKNLFLVVNIVATSISIQILMKIKAKALVQAVIGNLK